MVRKKIKIQILIGLILGAFLVATPALAFFVGDIEIKSKFGEIFEATFAVHLDTNKDYEVVLGDVDDYKKLGLTRPSIVNSLKLEKPVEATGTKKIIRVVSNNPLFFPSFNLVILARHNGGTLLENFLVTVDFQKGLAINALGKKNKKQTAPLAGPEIVKKDPPIKKEKVSPPVKGSGVPEQKAEKSPQKPKVTPEKPKESLPEETSADGALAVAPTPVVNRLQNRRRLSGAIWAVPKNVPPLVAEGRYPSSGDSILLEKGEGLFSVARKIQIQDIHPARIAVALWMRNIDKFIFGNINGIQAETRLEVSEIRELAGQIDLQTAKNVLNSQTKEWNLIKVKPGKVEDEKPSIQEVPLPTERIDQLASIFDWISGWKSSWEKDDIEKHISYYRTSGLENSEKSSALESPVGGKKKKLFSKHSNPSLNLSLPNLISKQGGSWVVFEQHFLSKSLESVGTKEVKILLENGNWKIEEEKFYAEENEITKSLRGENEKSSKNLPFVIHGSSHSNESEAISISNKLRENGYDAYTAPVRISKDIQIYRVYIGRFATWNQARRVVKVLRGKRLSGHATAIPYPFTLQVGEVSSIVESRQLLEKLRKTEISGLLSITKGGYQEGVQFRVFVGAFKKPENAVWMMQMLKEAGFSFKRIRP